MKKRTKTILTCATITGLYGAFLSALYLAQDKLVFKGASKLPKDQILPDKITSFNFISDDNVKIKAFCLGPMDAKNTILALPGNSGDSIKYINYLNLQLKKHFPLLSDYKIISLHYRGYGQSDGKLNGKLLINDCIEFAKKYNIQSVFGRSLGAGIGANIAANLNVNALLISPWDELALVAKDFTKKLTNNFIIRKIFKHNIVNNEVAKLATSKLYAIGFSKDKIIRKHRTLNIFNSWTGPKALKIIEGDHDKIINLSKDQLEILIENFK